MNLEIVTGLSKKTGKEWKGLRLSVGEWNTMIFPRSNFEMRYIETYMKEQKK